MPFPKQFTAGEKEAMTKGKGKKKKKGKKKSKPFPKRIPTY